MKRLLMFIPFLCCLGCQQGEEVATVDIEADIQAIREDYAEWEAVVAAANIDRWLSYIADNIVFIPPNESAYVGKEAFQSYFQQIFDKYNVQEKYVVKDVKVSGDLAVVYTTFSGIYTPKGGGNPIEPNGDGITVHQKQPDGPWKTIYMTWSNERLIYPEQAQ